MQVIDKLKEIEARKEHCKSTFDCLECKYYDRALEMCDNHVGGCDGYCTPSEMAEPLYLELIKKLENELVVFKDAYVDACNDYNMLASLIPSDCGKWITEENGCVILCSNCHERLELCYPDGTEVRELPYCPHCGRKMDRNKQVEEMGIDVSVAWQRANQKTATMATRPPLCDTIAEELFSMKYRKIREDEVVTTNEEYVEIIKDIYDFVNDFLEWDEENLIPNLAYHIKEKFGVEVE